MPTATKPKPAAKPRAMDHGPLSVDFAAQLLRERTDLAWVLGIGEPREATAEEKARYEERRLTDPAFGALYALSEQALRGEDVALLPVVAVDAGPAPELDALAAAADAYRAEFGLAPVAAEDGESPWPPGADTPWLDSHDVTDLPPIEDFAGLFKPELDDRAEGAVTRFLSAHDAEPAEADPVLEPDEDAPGTVIMPAADMHTTVIDAVEDDGAAA